MSDGSPVTPPAVDAKTTNEADDPMDRVMATGRRKNVAYLAKA